MVANQADLFHKSKHRFLHVTGYFVFLKFGLEVVHYDVGILHVFSFTHAFSYKTSQFKFYYNTRNEQTVFEESGEKFAGILNANLTLTVISNNFANSLSLYSKEYQNPNTNPQLCNHRSVV